MSAIHIHRTLDSDTLPELRPHVGKQVDIFVLVNEAGPHVIPPTTKDWAEVERPLKPFVRAATISMPGGNSATLIGRWLLKSNDPHRHKRID